MLSVPVTGGRAKDTCLIKRAAAAFYKIVHMAHFFICRLFYTGFGVSDSITFITGPYDLFSASAACQYCLNDIFILKSGYSPDLTGSKPASGFILGLPCHRFFCKDFDLCV